MFGRMRRPTQSLSVVLRIQSADSAQAAAALSPDGVDDGVSDAAAIENIHPGGGAMKGRRFWEFGGFIAGGILILFGAVAIYMGVDGYTTVRDSLKDEQVFFSEAADEDAATDKYASEWYGEQVTTGEQARAFAQIMRTHQLEGTEGLTYAQMGRFIAAENPDDPAGTSDEEAALKDEEGNPISNSARQSWVTAVAITTALNTSYMAEQLSIFGLVVGVALLLTGVGLVILAFAVFGREAEAASKPARAPKAIAAS
jgi:hypothetical protein